MTKKTYISLFSSAGVGCYGFKLEDFDCIATNELIERRLNIQRFNKKCKYDSGYICGDITREETKKLLYSQIEMWKMKENIDGVDVVIATPPCQGMSIANHKKSDTEIIRNSLVIESIKIIKKIHPKFFIFENVPAFMKTLCTDVAHVTKPISDAINNNLAVDYKYYSKVINFKNYGACSSRSRTIVVGVLKDYASDILPIELFPDLVKEKTLREIIGHLKPLENMGEIDPNDIYHSFRKYPENMRSWIHPLSEGESAFDNKNDMLKPHQIIDGKIIINKNKNGDKYTRQYWDKVGPCVHTRNDQLASQNTIHPSDDRVFSIRELMIMMSVPYNFKWSEYDLNYLNALSLEEKKKYLKKEEIKIRQSLGEAVPTAIFQSIAKKISAILSKTKFSKSKIENIIKQYSLSIYSNLETFIIRNPLNLPLEALSIIAEYANSNRVDNSAYYTSPYLIQKMMSELIVTNKNNINILEPSAGVGNFVPFIIDKFIDKNVILDIIDIDENSLRIAKILLDKVCIPDNFKINFIHDDFLTHEFDKKYDYIIGNPPFGKLKTNDPKRKLYLEKAKNKNTTNICSFFLDKAVDLSENIFLVFPKFLLNTPEFSSSRSYLSQLKIPTIIDFGEKGFPGVLIETIAIQIITNEKPDDVKIISLTKEINELKKQDYIMDNSLPYWVIYRNSSFDFVYNKLNFNVFNVFRDRQITNNLLQK